MSPGSETEAKALQPVIMRPGDAESIRPFGIDMKVMLGAEHTGGTFSAIVAEVKPGEGPPPHLHRDREEYFYVLEGTYSLGVNGKEFDDRSGHAGVCAARHGAHVQEYVGQHGQAAGMDHSRR